MASLSCTCLPPLPELTSVRLSALASAPTEAAMSSSRCPAAPLPLGCAARATVCASVSGATVAASLADASAAVVPSVQWRNPQIRQLSSEPVAHSSPPTRPRPRQRLLPGQHCEGQEQQKRQGLQLRIDRICCSGSSSSSTSNSSSSSSSSSHSSHSSSIGSSRGRRHPAPCFTSRARLPLSTPLFVESPPSSCSARPRSRSRSDSNHPRPTSSCSTLLSSSDANLSPYPLDKPDPNSAVGEDPGLTEAADRLFVVSAGEIQAACRDGGYADVTQYLTSLLPRVAAQARPPVSEFHVAALGLGVSGAAYAGVNLELPGLPLHHSVHAEQFVVANALQHGERGLTQLVVSHAPCGHCRQFLQEIRNAEALRVAVADKHAEEQLLHHFLPHRFGPHDLLDSDFPLLLEPRDNCLSLTSSSGIDHPSSLGHGTGSGNGAAATVSLSSDSDQSERGSGNGAAVSPSPDPKVVEAALVAANAAYAPYSESPSGVCLKARGQLFSGSYMESAAYNPSLPPLQAALVAMVAWSSGEEGDRGGPRLEWGEIEEAVLVERDGARVQQAETLRMVMRHIAPLARVTVVTAN